MTLAIAASAVYLTALARTLDLLEPLRYRRPLACNVCMAFWAGAPGHGLALATGQVGLEPWAIALSPLVTAALALAGLEVLEALRQVGGFADVPDAPPELIPGGDDWNDGARSEAVHP